MHTRPLGPFSVSAIGLGCMNLSAGYGAADPEQSVQLLNEALDCGYSLLDTAAIYGVGHNETLLGNTLQQRRHDYVLATKCGMTRDDSGLPKPNGRPDVLRRECEQSLKRLKTEVIDLYYLHRVDPDVAVEESVGTLGDLVREGKVRTLGLSEVCCDTLRRAQREHPIIAVQSEYSLWSRTPERGMLACCNELGITLVAFSPLGRGFLAGSASDITALDEIDLRATIARPRFEPEAFAANSRLLPPYFAIAQRLGCTPAQLALAWLLTQAEGQILPIPGTRNPNHLRENAAAAELQLDTATCAELDQLINEHSVTGSRYTEALMASSDAEKDR
ncbi:MAG TPA: aldo/keto reductase [Motiliproteus sp.]